jgi:hypothetical protein
MFTQPQMIALGPFQKFDLSYEFRLGPNTFLHIVGGQAFAPTRTMRLRKIYERTGRHHERS